MAEINADERLLLIVSGVAGLIVIALVIALAVFLLRKPRK